MKNTTENTKSAADHGPIAQPGLTGREYREMRTLERQEREDYLDYINER
jgi:hypothetical protein